MHTGTLETRMAVETPEGVELLLTPAGPGARFLAFLIDALIRFFILASLGLLFAFLELLGQGLYFLAIFLLEWFYPVLFEVYRQGATPGKRALQLRVLHDNGTPVTFGGSMVRNLLRVVDFLPLFYVTGLVAMLMNRRFKRLGDLAAGTLVVYEFPKPARPALKAEQALPAPVPLALEEQRAVIAFAERSSRLSAGRQIELADQLKPMLQCQGDAAVEKLHQIANGLTGRSGPHSS